MATVTSPIILDSTGQDIKDSIDLLTANINRTASNIPYDSNLTIKGKIDAIDGELDDLAFTKTSNGATSGEYGFFSVSFTYGGTTYSNVPILGVHIQGNADLGDRDSYIGQVVAGSYAGRFVAVSPVGVVMINPS